MVSSIAEIKQKLEEEHDFSFNKTNVPKELIPLLEEIENNKRKWKSLYMAVWGFSLQVLKPKYIDKNQGDNLMTFELPASKLKRVLYTPNKLFRYLTTYDPDIYISQLIKIFTLLEDYMFEYYDLNKNKESLVQKIFKFLLNSKFVKYLIKKSSKVKSKVDKIKNKLQIQQKDFTRFNILKRYLKENNFADKKELLELEYAKETRNSYVHRRGKVNDTWLNIYKKTGRNKNFSLNENIPLEFYDLEDWTDIIINIVKKCLKKYSD
jgi:hypothetical protein